MFCTSIARCCSQLPWSFSILCALSYLRPEIHDRRAVQHDDETQAYTQTPSDVFISGDVFQRANDSECYIYFFSTAYIDMFSNRISSRVASSSALPWVFRAACDETLQTPSNHYPTYGWRFIVFLVSDSCTPGCFLFAECSLLFSFLSTSFRLFPALFASSYKFCVPLLEMPRDQKTETK